MTLSHTLLFYLALIIGSLALKYPYPYPNDVSPCNAQPPPPIISFHVHAVFDGTNKTIAQAALNLRSAFIEYANPKMEQCPFSHANSAEYYSDICYFPFNATMKAFPFFISHIFGATDFAFFIPQTHLLIADLWWRQHYDRNLNSFMIHPNTGCEDNSHTIWAMVNENYPYKTNKTGLFCCHDGPEKCYCDIVQYRNAQNGKCLTANYSSNTFALAQCGNSDAAEYDNTNFRETYYNDTFIQLENFGDINANTYMCLGQDSKNKASVCTEGNAIKLIECYQTDERLNLFNWVEGKIKSLKCNTDVCVDYDEQTKRFVLNDCVKSMQFNRFWYRN